MVQSAMRFLGLKRDDVVDDLMKLARGDVQLLQDAIRASTGPTGEADLEKVVDHLVRTLDHREPKAA